MLELILAGVAGTGLGAVLTYIFAVRPLTNLVAQMRIVGFDPPRRIGRTKPEDVAFEHNET
jgi:hypothetical protein